MASARAEEARPVTFACSARAALGPKCDIYIYIYIYRKPVPAVQLGELASLTN